MSKIIELIDDFRLNQQIQDRTPEYIDLCMYRIKRWYSFMVNEFESVEVEDVQQLHMKKYIQHCQQLGKEKQITINGSLSTLRVFFNYLVDE
ncbi:MAG: site-specific integrase, partial [Psychrobacillus psychrotolerans]